GQDHEHPRPLLHHQAHDRRHEAEHLRGAGGVRSIIEDLEVTVDALREELHLFADPKGAMVGPITVVDSGDTIDLRRMGSGGWSVPSIVEENVIAFKKHEAEYVLLVEKAA